jgi:hypothetical protein
MLITDWILEQNLRPFIAFVAACLGCEFSREQWQEIRQAVAESDARAGRWHESELAGAHTSMISFARQADSGAVLIRLDTDEKTALRVQAAIALMRQYLLRDAD